MNDEEYIKNISSISTEELFNSLEYYGYDSYYADLWRATIDELKKRIEERPQDEWIPVGERLPEGKIDPMTNDFELALCSTVWDVVRPYKFGKPIGHAKAHFWSGGGIMDDYVIAWMPLPEPYKEAEE